MLELLKKGMFAGLGAAALTREKIREATRTLVEDGKISSDEAEKLAEDLVQSGEREWGDVDLQISVVPQENFRKPGGGPQEGFPGPEGQGGTA